MMVHAHMHDYACICNQGPLLLLKGWHPELLSICTMHVVNLGLGYRVNGSGVFLARAFLFKFCDIIMD